MMKHITRSVRYVLVKDMLADTPGILAMHNDDLLRFHCYCPMYEKVVTRRVANAHLYPLLTDKEEFVLKLNGHFDKLTQQILDLEVWIVMQMSTVFAPNLNMELILQRDSSIMCMKEDVYE